MTLPVLTSLKYSFITVKSNRLAGSRPCQTAQSTPHYRLVNVFQSLSSIIYPRMVHKHCHQSSGYYIAWYQPVMLKVLESQNIDTLYITYFPAPIINSRAILLVSM